ncbi:MAG TPA: hypothetical protein VGY76_03470 [Solirubrobacteraceae bacterium]|jgi:hypothetical protein|nr:hypothetical protein [Solirubrobacteraceae bacterium]
MRRKNEKHEPELEGIAERMRAERPEASPLELDQIKLSAMSRAKAATGRANPRRLVVAALTVGLMAAGTGGVLAAGGSGGAAGNAASAQYSSTTVACGNNNGNGNSGNESGNGNGNYNCNNNSFNNSGNTINNITNNYNTSSTTTVTVSSSASLGVAGTKVNKTSSRRLRIHVKLPHKKGKLRSVSIKVNGKQIKTISGKKASANVVLANLPCGNGTTTVTITITLSSGKTVTQSHTYHLCT